MPMPQSTLQPMMRRPILEKVSGYGWPLSLPGPHRQAVVVAAPIGKLRVNIGHLLANEKSIIDSYITTLPVSHHDFVPKGRGTITTEGRLSYEAKKVVDITKMRDDAIVPTHRHLSFLISVGGIQISRESYPEIPLSATEHSTFMPPPLATSEPMKDSLLVSQRTLIARLDSLKTLAQLERSFDHSEVVYIWAKLDETRATVKELQESGPLVEDIGVELRTKNIARLLASLLDSPSRSSPPRDPAPPRNPGKRQLEEEDGEIEEEDDPDMVPEEASQIRATKLESL
ncbi:hypothetical protein HAX54_033844 [Datura stramonium]|uniref:Uncharacterized protein n=1 Tax=Datura stramonium TaxID=4076 RepID=A0ABS8VD04_DATST|nr:hypothetical protein [Datura stramonium]